MDVLLVEDDEGVGAALVDVLRAQGHRPTWGRRGADLLIHHRAADVVVLDLGLPDADGLAALHTLRQVSSVPVLVLTARGDDTSMLRAFHCGADDYVVKPVRVPILLARLRAVADRRRPPADRPTTVQVEDVVVDLTARTVVAGATPVILTAKEFDILAVLARGAGTAVSRQQITDEVWGGGAVVTASKALGVHMSTLRAKLDRPDLIRTIRDFGFRLG